MLKMVFFVFVSWYFVLTLPPPIDAVRASPSQCCFFLCCFCVVVAFFLFFILS